MITDTVQPYRVVSRRLAEGRGARYQTQMRARRVLLLPALLATCTGGPADSSDTGSATTTSSTTGSTTSEPVTGGATDPTPTSTTTGEPPTTGSTTDETTAPVSGSTGETASDPGTSTSGADTTGTSDCGCSVTVCLPDGDRSRAHRRVGRAARARRRACSCMNTWLEPTTANTRAPGRSAPRRRVTMCSSRCCASVADSTLV